MKWYFKAFYQYFNFSGRARRKEFWVFFLTNIFIYWILTNLYRFTDADLTNVPYIFLAIILIPSIAVLLRRLHDSGKNGWNILFVFIPILGWFWLLILLILLGEPKLNKWGPYPKGITEN
ncbi:Uncharacterized membrane protein YhaH, DUF805 family [Polaribacter sp. KT25b]|uniref:DUF805 domain-containing protein n=1 Tax=Polaribacter sp. KT25b TaxID=1855336 RepID=UPI00087D66B8|nr:DUF805 domain-containing protein [Polaribacter sp. KT25b]SDR97470.1 Uncharacterized membrane protein YhaH, DUF805 family [Polaribacter sp. KT25b]